MKRFVLYLIIPLFSLSVSAADYYTITADVLNVRNAPSKDGEVISVARYGDVVMSESEANNGWIKIKTSSVSGYVSTEYLRFSHSKDNDTAKNTNLSGNGIGIWGWIVILFVIAVIGRLLRSLSEAVDTIIGLVVLIVVIIVWSSNGFWMGLLTFFIGSVCMVLLFGMGSGTVIRRYGRKYTLTCDKCGYEKLEIVSEFEGGVTTKCKRCGEVVGHILNH